MLFENLTVEEEAILDEWRPSLVLPCMDWGKKYGKFLPPDAKF
jgi:hypothetical protein